MLFIPQEDTLGGSPLCSWLMGTGGESDVKGGGVKIKHERKGKSVKVN